jgi:hypothetical protein
MTDTQADRSRIYVLHATPPELVAGGRRGSASQVTQPRRVP